MRRIQVQGLKEDSFLDFDGNAVIAEGLGSKFYPPASVAAVYSWRYQYLKRALDFAFAVCLTLVFAIPCLVIAVLIVLTSPGSPFYREERVGRDGTPFMIWKFRSMHRHAHRHHHVSTEHATGKVLQWRMQKHLRDPRITFIGGFLRKWSLDELPQLINVLRGEMSFIGPRPIVEAEMALYHGFISYYLAARPGLSGLWQVSGRSNVDYDKRARLDANYVQNWSLWLDFVIFLRTFPSVLNRVGAR